MSHGGFSGGGEGFAADSVKRAKDTWLQLTDRGMWIEYEGNKKIRQHHFRLKKEGSITGADRTMLVFGNGMSYSYTLHGDTILGLSQEAYDGLAYSYHKR